MPNQAGKGDTYRPVDKKKYDANFESIKWGKNTSKNNSNKVVRSIRRKTRYSY